MKRVLVTGATGFLGRHVVAALLESSRNQVRILSRGTNPWAGDRRVECVSGDINDPDLVRAAVREVGVVLHLAGVVRRDPGAAELMRQVHVEGTRNVCDAALAGSRPRVVVASSSGTIAVGREPVVYDETAPFASDTVVGWPYYLSKIEQERLALSYFGTDGLDVVILNPSIVLGPGDVHRSSTNDVRLFLDRRIPNVPSGGLNFVDARDAARAFVAAIDRGAGGSRYLIGGHNMTIREFFGLLERVSGVRSPRLALPEWLARGSAAMLRNLARIAGRDFAVDDTSIEMAYHFWYLDNRRAREELGFEARRAETTLRDTVDDIRNEDPPASGT